MKRNEFQTFMNVLKLIKDYNSDVVIEDGQIFQVSDSRTCILDIDMSKLFNDSADSKDIKLTNLNLKVSVLNILKDSLVNEDDFISIMKVNNDKYLRFSYNNSQFYVDFRTPMIDLDALRKTSVNLKEIVNNIQDKLIFSKHYTVDEYKKIKVLQTQSGAKDVGFYYYKGKGIVFISGSGSSINIKVEDWVPNFEIDTDEMVKVNFLTDIIFPEAGYDIDLKVYYDTERFYTVSSVNIDDLVTFNVFSSWYMDKVTSSNDVNTMLKYFDGSKSKSTEKIESKNIQKVDSEEENNIIQMPNVEKEPSKETDIIDLDELDALDDDFDI